MRLLTQGFTARSVLQQLMANDPYAEYRQIGVIDRSGMAVAIPARTRAAGRAMSSGENYVAFGNGLVGPEVADAIAKGFLAEPDADLEHRLLMGIEAGRDAGGQGTRERHKAERSAALRVYSRTRYADIDLRVDLHATAVEELRRVWTEYKQYEGYYRDRERNPSGAKWQEEFMTDVAGGGGINDLLDHRALPAHRPARPRHRHLLDRRRRTLRRHPAGVGICKTQAYINRGNDPLAIELLAQGHNPAHVMKMLEHNDPDHAYRQIAHHRPRGQWRRPYRVGNAAVVGPQDRHGLSWPSATCWPGRR